MKIRESREHITGGAHNHKRLKISFFRKISQSIHCIAKEKAIRPKMNSAAVRNCALCKKMATKEPKYKFSEMLKAEAHKVNKIRGRIRECFFIETPFLVQRYSAKQ